MQAKKGNARSPVVTNLRLPGQYLERGANPTDAGLLASVGLQGPYYNWHRWYLPSMGRYLELDPTAVRGGFNGPYGPNWYGHAEGNPLRFTDPLGLDAEMCLRRFSPIFLMPYARHCFVRFNGDDKDTMSYDNSRVGPDQGFGWLSRACTMTSGQQNDACVKREMGKCDPKQYDFTGFNCCHCVEQAFNSCGLLVPIDSWPNWPVNPGPQPGEQGSCAKGPPSNACSERR